MIMIRSVCFSRHIFRQEMLKRICRETKGQMAGFLTDPSMVNCIESFPDGSIYYSFAPKQMPSHVFNCQGDINRFIQANTRMNIHRT